VFWVDAKVGGASAGTVIVRSSSPASRSIFPIRAAGARSTTRVV
jgi:hypothetical protein